MINFPLTTSIDLNCTLAIASSFTDSFGGHAQASPRSLNYLSKTYALVNKKLSGPEATSSSVIATVTSLVVYHRIHDFQETGLIHFHGLERIIRPRGGMAALARESPIIALKPWR
jgi:transcription factor-like protein